jgi:hypothetical protein
MTATAAKPGAARLWATTFDEARRLAPAAPYLVSFPRTGSHWLRMFLETYTDRPLLTRSFLPHGSEDFLLIHTHDLSGEVDDARDVLYLHRGAVDTVHSELTYRVGESAPEAPWSAVEGVARAYLDHLTRWLLGSAPRRRFLAVTYESLRERPGVTLASMVEFLGGEADAARIEALWPTITRAAVADSTGHDPRVIDRGGDADARRREFRGKHAPRLRALFRESPLLVERAGASLLE